MKYAQIPEALLYAKVDDSPKIVYGCLHRHGTTPDTCHPSHQRIGQLTHRSKSTVQRALDWLDEHGWIDVVPRWRDDGGQSSNGYRLHATPKARQQTLPVDAPAPPPAPPVAEPEVRPAGADLAAAARAELQTARRRARRVQAVA